MKSELKKALADLHTVEMELNRLYTSNEEYLKGVFIADDLWRDTAQWKYFKSLESIFNAKKCLNKIYQVLPKVKKSKLDHVIAITKQDLLINILNLLSEKAEAVMMDVDDTPIEVLLELQEVLYKIE